ncbi:MAG: hypothetical protein IOD01_16525 [Rhodobacter sp.]|nr:hypothetical protein [Rhodobacter sp.]
MPSSASGGRGKTLSGKELRRGQNRVALMQVRRTHVCVICPSVLMGDVHGTARAGGERRAPLTAGASPDCPIRVTGMRAARAAGPDAPAALRYRKPPDQRNWTA